ncbi:hypothetical protein K523DRAFT_319878, partial [Schizophyllum commune Tattone D]
LAPPAAPTTPPTACRLCLPFIPARPGTSLGRESTQRSPSTLLSPSTLPNLSTAPLSPNPAHPNPNTALLRMVRLSLRTARPSNPTVHPIPNTRRNTTNPTQASRTRAGVA